MIRTKKQKITILYIKDLFLNIFKNIKERNKYKDEIIN